MEKLLSRVCIADIIEDSRRAVMIQEHLRQTSSIFQHLGNVNQTDMEPVKRMIQEWDVRHSQLYGQRVRIRLRITFSNSYTNYIHMLGKHVPGLLDIHLELNNAKDGAIFFVTKSTRILHPVSRMHQSVQRELNKNILTSFVSLSERFYCL